MCSKGLFTDEYEVTKLELEPAILGNLSGCKSTILSITATGLVPYSLC